MISPFGIAERSCVVTRQRVARFEPRAEPSPLVPHTKQEPTAPFLYGGERGIRTLDRGLTYTPLAGERLQPLGHLSGTRIVAHTTGVLSTHLLDPECKSENRWLGRPHA